MKRKNESGYEKGFEAHYMYKCRLCGTEVSKMVGGWHRYPIIRTLCKFTINDGKNMGHNEPDLFDIHSCRSGKKETGMGIADFIGVKKVKTPLIRRG